MRDPIRPVMQSTMQSQNDRDSIEERIANGTSNGLGNSHTPYSTLHSPAERLENLTSPGAEDLPDDITAIGDVISALPIWQPAATRHPRVRIGERDPIPLHVRAAVWYRDRGLCDECPQEHQRSAAIHLDHIKPWSAGGTDTTDNLRVLCEPHNVERSNFVDGARSKRSATWWCHRCHDLDYNLLGDNMLLCPLHPWTEFGVQSRCRAARAIKRWEDGSWFLRPAPEYYPHIAYCAHCDAPGMTGVLL